MTTRMCHTYLRSRNFRTSMGVELLLDLLRKGFLGKELSDTFSERSALSLEGLCRRRFSMRLRFVPYLVVLKWTYCNNNEWFFRNFQWWMEKFSPTWRPIMSRQSATDLARFKVPFPHSFKISLFEKRGRTNVRDSKPKGHPLCQTEFMVASNLVFIERIYSQTDNLQCIPRPSVT